MNVIRHQAKAENSQTRFADSSREQGKVAVAVFVVKEHLAPELSSLGDMVRAPDGYHPVNASHHPYTERAGRKISAILEVG